MMTRNSGRVLGALVAVRTIEALAASAMLPFVVLWAARDAGLSGPAAGLLFIAQAVGEFAAGLVAGTFADRLGHRRVLLVSTTGMALGYGLLALAGRPVFAVGLFLLAGVFESAFHPTVAAILGDSTDDDRLTHAFGLLNVGSNAGRIAGPLLGALVVLGDLHRVFVLTGGLLVVAVVVELGLLPRDVAGQESDEEPEIPPGTLRALRTDPVLAVLVLAGGLLATTAGWWEADGLVVLREQTPLSTTQFALLSTIAAAVVVAGQVPVTRLLRDRSPGQALAVGATLQGAGLAVLALGHLGFGVLVVAVVGSALGSMVYAPTVSTIVSRRAGRGRQASYQAALSITEDIGTAVGPISGLALVKVTTAAGLWVVAGVVSTVAGLVGGSATQRSVHRATHQVTT